MLHKILVALGLHLSAKQIEAALALSGLEYCDGCGFLPAACHCRCGVCGEYVTMHRCACKRGE